MRDRVWPSLQRARSQEYTCTLAIAIGMSWESQETENPEPSTFPKVVQGLHEYDVQCILGFLCHSVRSLSQLASPPHCGRLAYNNGEGRKERTEQSA